MFCYTRIGVHTKRPASWRRGLAAIRRATQNSLFWVSIFTCIPLRRCDKQNLDFGREVPNRPYNTCHREPEPMSRSRGSDHPGQPPSLTSSSHHGTRLGSAPVLRATDLEGTWENTGSRAGAPGERPGLP